MKGQIDIVEHGQGYTLNVWAYNPTRLLCPVTLDSVDTEVLCQVAKREFGSGMLRRRNRNSATRTITFEVFGE